MTSFFGRTYIFTFDSLGHPHAQVIKRLTAYLRIEAKNKRGVDAAGMIDGINAPVPLLIFSCHLH